MYAHATAQQMFQGKQYARGLRGIRIVQEALFWCFFVLMESWLRQQGKDFMVEGFDIQIQRLVAVITNNDRMSARQTSKELNSKASEVEKIIKDFREMGEAKSETFSFWCKYLDGADILLRLLRAERDGDFILHISATHETVPWFNAAGRRVYAKYVPTYIADMANLEKQIPRHISISVTVVLWSEGLLAAVLTVWHQTKH